MKKGNMKQGEYDEELYIKLNRFRNLIFRHYRFYNNKTLTAFATLKPVTEEEVLKIDPDKEKFDDFGNEFIRIINNHLISQKIGVDVKIDENLASYKRIQDFEERIFEIIQYMVKRKYEEQWWYEGIPIEVRKKAAELHEEGGGKIPKEYCLNLIHLKIIIKKSWQVFSPVMDKENRGKEAFSGWFDRINDIRNKLSHRMRLMNDPLLPEDLDFVKEKSEWVEEIFNDILGNDIEED